MQANARRRTGRAGVVAAVTFALVPVVGISPAHACSCVGGSEAEHYQRADAVFKGTLTGTTPPPARPDGMMSSADPVIHTFAVSRSYKGTVIDPQRVRSSVSGASCGLELHGAGPFLVFAHLPRDNDGPGTAYPADQILEADLCGGTREIGASEDPSFGKGKAVREQRPAPAGTWGQDGADGRDGEDVGGGRGGKGGEGGPAGSVGSTEGAEQATPAETAAFQGALLALWDTLSAFLGPLPGLLLAAFHAEGSANRP